MGKEEQQMVYMDYMKTLGIICLLVWHASFTKFFVYTTMFFLQIFFFISGYFYKDNYTKSPLTFLIRRTKSLYLPYIAYGLFLLSINNFLVQIGVLEQIFKLDIKSLTHSMFSVLVMNGIPKSNQMAGAMWFIPVLFFSSILFNLINYCVKNTKNAYFESLRFLSVTLMFSLGCWLTLRHRSLPIQMDISLAALPFYYLGYLFKQHQEKISLNIFYALAALLLLVLCREYGLIRMAKRMYQNPPFLLMSGCAGIYLGLFVSQKMASIFGERKLIVYVGRNTMPILALHFLAFKVINWFMMITLGLPPSSITAYPVIPTANQFWRFGYITAGFFIPLLTHYSCTHLLSRVLSLCKHQRMGGA